MKPEKKFISVRHAAEVYDLPRSTIHDWIYAGRFTAVRVGRVVRIELKSFEAFLARHRVRELDDLAISEIRV